MFVTPKWFFLILAVAICGPSDSLGRTISVELDGSGDYVAIQPALDVAASGDTVLIGPGEYTTLNPSYIPGYAWDVDVGAYVRVPDLTLIGAGAGLTVIGPTSYQGDSQTFSPQALVWLDGGLRRIEGITIRNCYAGIHATNGPVYVYGCSFEDNSIGIFWLTDAHGGHILASSMETSVGGALSVRLIGSGSDIEISNLVSTGGMLAIDGPTRVVLSDCHIGGTGVGLQFGSGSECRVENSTIENCSVIGLGITQSGASVEVIDCILSGGQGAIAANRNADLSVENSQLVGGTHSVVYMYNPAAVSIHGSHLIRTSGYTIVSFRHELLGLHTYDFSGNYWGTTDTAEIDSWIQDRSDDPANFAIIDYLPLADDPMATEEKSWGAVKSMFR